MPRISVIVPVYKVQSYIRPCVDSILAQSFSDIEVILVDDGSPDNCGVICDEYASKDQRVRVIHKANGGLSAARNTGVDAAKGEYICFVDSDDLIAPDYCRVLLELLGNSHHDFSVCGVCRFQDGNDPIPQNEEETTVVSNTEFLKMQLEHRTEFGVWNKLFRRQVLETIRFASGRLNEDVIFSAELAKNLRNGAVFTSRELYFYRQRSGGIVSTQAQRGSPDRIYAGEYLLRTVLQNFPQLTDLTLQYAVEYPWMFVDPIYVKGEFKKNRIFLHEMQFFLRTFLPQYKEKRIFSQILTFRMELFARSRVLYGLNAYTRLLRVYLFRLIGKDPYSGGHGI